MYRKILTVLLIPGILFLLFSGCSRRLHKTSTFKVVVTYPPPPDTARIQFLTSFSSSENSTGKQSAFSRFIFGESPVKPIKKPYGIAMHGGKIYICDTGMGLIEVIDLEKNTFTYFEPIGNGKLKLPLNCFVDDTGKLYVADGIRMQVVVFEADGTYIGAFGETDKFKPTDVFVTGDTIWVTNIKNNRINVYKKNTRELLYTFPDAEQGQPGYLYSPANIYVTPDKVYVSDIGDFNVRPIPMMGNTCHLWEATGAALASLHDPKVSP
ncbi:MAG: hypothetical protein M0Q38_07285 [Bacteroidales bacterium]|jgi:hypothetical protein|nr:hypothetical protein [Bacteroidales bacterium]